NGMADVQDWNAVIYQSIGKLVVNWANNESVFLKLFQVAMSVEPFVANLIWSSQRTTAARLDLLLRFCQARIKDEEFLSAVLKAVKDFKGLTKVRNRYCHCLYEYDADGRLLGAQNVTVSDQGEPLRVDQKTFGP